MTPRARAGRARRSRAPHRPGPALGIAPARWLQPDDRAAVWSHSHELTAVGAWLRQVEGAVQFWIGDWVNYGESRWGEKYSQALEATGLQLGTLQNYAYVAQNVNASLRSEQVSWTLHKELAPLPPKEQKQWLARAADESMTVADLRTALRLEVAHQRNVIAAQRVCRAEPSNYATSRRCHVLCAFGDRAAPHSQAAGQYVAQNVSLSLRSDKPLGAHGAVTHRARRSQGFCPQ